MLLNYLDFDVLIKIEKPYFQGNNTFFNYPSVSFGIIKGTTCCLYNLTYPH